MVLACGAATLTSWPQVASGAAHRPAASRSNPSRDDTTAAEEAKIRKLLQNFHVFQETRDFDSLSSLVVPDLTAIWSGKKYDGWQDYDQQVLAPLASEPSPNNTWQIDKLVVTPQMAWAYTTTTQSVNIQGTPTDVTVWTTFILERRASTAPLTGKFSSETGDWKIVYLSIATNRGAATTPNPAGSPSSQKKVQNRPSRP